MSLPDDLESLRGAIDRIHGLAGTGELARAWGVSKQRVHALARREGFPAPVAHIGQRAVWARAEVDAWRATQTAPKDDTS